MTAQRAYTSTERDVGEALRQLASGSRYTTPGTDPAGMAISESLKAQVKGYQAAQRNAETATSFIQVGEAALSEQNNIIIRLRELAVQGASDTLSDRERGYLNDEYQSLTKEFDRIAKSTSYGSTKLLNGSTQSYEFQVGINKGPDNIIGYNNNTDTTASNLGLDGLDVTDKGDARDALESLDSAMKQIGGERAKLGAVQSRLDTTVSHLSSQTETISEAASKQGDTDIADAIGRVRRGQILMQYQTSAMQMSNQNLESAIRLIG